MPDNGTREVLEIAATLRAENLINGAKKAEKEASKRFGLVRKAVESLSKPLDKVGKAAVRSLKVWRAEADANRKANERLYSTADRMATELLSLHKKLKDATREETRAIQEQIEVLEDKYKAQMRNASAGAKARQLVRGAVARKAEEREESGKKAIEEFATYDFGEAGKDMFESFADGVSSLRGKDLGGLIKGLTSGIGAGLKGIGAKATRVAAGAETAGPLTGMFKAIAPLMKSLGPTLNMLGKMGPLLGALSSTVVGIVKLLLDAEAAAKDFNKGILETAGSAQFLYQNMGNVNAGAADLGDTVAEMYKQATSLDNLDWGINKSTHQAVLNSLSAEGVSLKRLQADFENTAKASKEAAGYAKDFGTTVQMSVAYSRMFGVSLNEITTFQSEMMTEMGASLSTVEKTFTMMSQGAEEAGIASNKFFAIIRGISADLNLYNTRMEDAVHMLTMLGKVMSPKNAQKFMQASTGALKNMGRTERLKAALLTGGKAGAVVDRDIKRTADSLVSRMQDATKGAFSDTEIRNAIETGGEALQKILGKVPEEMRG